MRTKIVTVTLLGILVLAASGCGHKDQASAPGSAPPPDFAQQNQARMQAEQAQAARAHPGTAH